MRRVRIFKHERRKDGTALYDRVLDTEGTFHQWGCDFEEFETNAANFSTAIVELDNGTVRNVPAELIDFVTPIKEES